MNQGDIIKQKCVLLKTSVSLANSTAKLRFLSTCLDLNVLPKGFHLKFSLQTGLPQDAGDECTNSVTEVLSGTSVYSFDSRIYSSEESSTMNHKYSLLLSAASNIILYSCALSKRSW